MRQQMYKSTRYNDTVATALEFGGNRTGQSHDSYSSDLRHKQRVLRVAQQIGLPPASTRLVSMWPDTLTDGEGERPLELGRMPEDELAIVENGWRAARDHTEDTSLTRSYLGSAESGMGCSRTDQDKGDEERHDQNWVGDPPGLPEPAYHA